MDSNRSRRRKFLPALLDFKQTIDPDRQYRYAQIIGEQAYSGTKCGYAAIFGVFSLREDEHAVTAIDGLAGVCEALSKT